MMRILFLLGAALAGGVYAGAALAGAARAAPRPAVLARPDQACLAEIGAAIKAATGRDAVLADTVFQHGGTLLLEPAQPRDETGMPRTGRILEAPLRVELRLERGACVLAIGARSRPLRACGCKQAP